MNRERESRARGKRACASAANSARYEWLQRGMEDTGRRYLHDTVDTTMTSSTSTLISIPLCDLSGV